MTALSTPFPALFTRPRPPCKVQGQPFTTMLVPDRASGEWQEVMATRYYLYQVHTSLTFVHTPSLAAALYLCLVRLLARDYAAAAAAVATCTVDVAFTAEERWLMGRFARAADDCHPDAHAVRLKLTLMVAFSDNKTPWEAHVEMGRYLAKLPHVSAACRLSDDEEVTLQRKESRALASSVRCVDFIVLFIIAVHGVSEDSLVCMAVGSRVAAVQTRWPDAAESS